MTDTEHAGPVDLVQSALDAWGRIPTSTPTAAEAIVEWLAERGYAVSPRVDTEGDGPLFVIFDGPPSHETGRFVEVETAERRSVGAGLEWAERDDGLWSLGPFFRRSQNVTV